MTFLAAAFSRQLTDGGLIDSQTDSALTTGTGIYDLHDRKPTDSISEYSMSYATKSQIGGGPMQAFYSSMGLPMPKATTKGKKDMSLSNILKSEVLNWYLFKSGLREPRVNYLTHEQALNDGLSTINDLLAHKHD